MDRMQKGLMVSIILVSILLVIIIILLFQSYNPEAPKTGVFFNSLQTSVNQAWNSPQASIVFESGLPWLPESVDYVCFADFEKELKGRHIEIGQKLSEYQNTGANLYLYPFTDIRMKYFDIQKIDLNWIIREENPYCVDTMNNTIRLSLEKIPGGKLVRIR